MAPNINLRAADGNGVMCLRRTNITRDVTRSIMMSGKIRVNLFKIFTAYPQTVLRSQSSHSHAHQELVVVISSILPDNIITVCHTTVDAAIFNHPQTVFRSQSTHSHAHQEVVVVLVSILPDSIIHHENHTAQSSQIDRAERR